MTKTVYSEIQRIPTKPFPSMLSKSKRIQKSNAFNSVTSSNPSKSQSKINSDQKSKKKIDDPTAASIAELKQFTGSSLRQRQML